MCIYRAASRCFGGRVCSPGTSARVALLIVTLGPALAGYSGSSAEEIIEAYSPAAPRFDSRQPTEIRATVGQPVMLPCIVHNLTDKLVSWIRTRDLNILTHGTATFTADPRFDIQHASAASSWTLKLRGARTNDTGRYECQVNTDPKMSLFFNLVVQERSTVKVRVSGPKDQYVAVGSTVTFVCEVTAEGYQGIRKEAVHWLHDGLALSFQASRGGISMDTTRSERSISSRLTVAGVGRDDGGRYTCAVHDAADTLLLHVTDNDFGEHMEAMQRDQAVSGAEMCIQCETAFVYAVLVLLTEKYLANMALG